MTLAILFFIFQNDELENFSPSWNNINGKPSRFPPSEHTHDKLIGYNNSGWEFGFKWDTSDPADNRLDFYVSGGIVFSSSHNHDDKYYRKDHIDEELNGKIIANYFGTFVRRSQSGMVAFTYGEVGCYGRPECICITNTNIKGFNNYDFDNSNDGYIRIYFYDINGNAIADQNVRGSIIVYEPSTWIL